MKGRKRHGVVDTPGLPLVLQVHPANAQDRDILALAAAFRAQARVETDHEPFAGEVGAGALGHRLSEIPNRSRTWSMHRR